MPEIQSREILTASMNKLREFKYMKKDKFNLKTILLLIIFFGAIIASVINLIVTLLNR